MAGGEVRKRLRRSADAKIGGVAAGIAEYLDLDPTIVRVIFALLLILGAGVTWLLVYVVLWVVMPEPEVDASSGVRGASAAGRCGGSRGRVHSRADCPLGSG